MKSSYFEQPKEPERISMV